MPPKKKAIKEPNVTVPEGDASAGRGTFDAKCSACHAFEGNTKLTKFFLETSLNCLTIRFLFKIISI